MGSLILSIIFVLGSVAALWLALSVAAFLFVLWVFVWHPRYAAPLWVDIVVNVLLAPLLMLTYVWEVIGMSGPEAQRRALDRGDLY